MKTATERKLYVLREFKKLNLSDMPLSNTRYWVDNIIMASPFQLCSFPQAGLSECLELDG